jgi:nicotinamidase-related amidase
MILQSHICVLQTVLDLLYRGIDVHVLADGVSSQRVGDRQVALEVSVSVCVVCVSTFSLLVKTLVIVLLFIV